jgi:hypothetical protein
VGFVAVSFARESSWIEHLYVSPAYLHCGAGSGLLDHARNELDHRSGCIRFSAMTSRDVSTNARSG